MTVIVRQALSSDVEPAVAVLMAGFFSDPVLVWLVPEGRTRRRFLRGFFHAAFEDSHQSGELRVAEDEGEVCGVAVWYPPGRVRDPTGPAMDNALAALDDADLDRLAALGEATIDYAPIKPHFYLWSGARMTLPGGAESPTDTEATRCLADPGRYGFRGRDCIG